MTTEFFVSPYVTRPIVGVGALATMGMTIDCASRGIINNRTEGILLCTVAFAEKTEEAGMQDVCRSL